jgi:hypothetical protein
MIIAFVPKVRKETNFVEDLVTNNEYWIKMYTPRFTIRISVQKFPGWFSAREEVSNHDRRGCTLAGR